MEYFQKEIETMSPDQKFVLQSEKLVKIVKHVYENQKPYREKMDAIRLKPSDPCRQYRPQRDQADPDRWQSLRRFGEATA